MTDKDLFSEGPPHLSLSPDLAFELMKTSRRRQVIKILADKEKTSLPDLAEMLAAEENNVEPEDVTEKDRKRAYVSLYKIYIPDLDQEGLIDYDSYSGEVTANEEIRLLNSFLTTVDHAFE